MAPSQPSIPSLIPHFLGQIPDPRPSKAHPHHRAQRKAIEAEHPHFDFKELALKAGVLALLAVIALTPKVMDGAEVLAGKAKGRTKTKGSDRDMGTEDGKGGKSKENSRERDREMRRREGEVLKKDRGGNDRREDKGGKRQSVAGVDDDSAQLRAREDRGGVIDQGQRNWETEQLRESERRNSRKGSKREEKCRVHWR